MVAKHPEDEDRRVLAVTKTNISVLPQSIAFRVDVDESRDVSRITWGGETSFRANDLLEQTRPKSTALGEAEEFLVDVLRHGPVPVKEVSHLAGEADITPATPRRAKVSLGVGTRKIGGPNNEKQYWAAFLPEDDHEEPKVLNENSWSSSTNDDHLRSRVDLETEVFEA